jgi:hypothetical protein
MKKIFLFTLLFGLFISIGVAQSTTLNGPIVDMDRYGKFLLINDSEDQIVFVTKQRKIGLADESYFLIHRYDKQEHYTETQKIDEKLGCNFAYFYDNQATVIKQTTNGKAKAVEYLRASVPTSAEKIKKLSFEPFLQAPLEKYKFSFSHIVYSPDYSKFAILTILKPNSSRNIDHIADVAVFESNGVQLWHQRQHAHWLVNDQIPFYLSNDGTVYIAEFGSYYNPQVHQTDSLHISVYNSNGIWNYAEGFGYDATFNCGKAVLKDGRFVVCGVPCLNQRNSGLLITYFVTPDGEVDKEESSIDISFNDGYVYEAREFNSNPGFFLPYFFDIKELNNGNLMLVGELNYRDQVGTSITIGSSWGVSDIMGYISKNIIVTTITDNGEVLNTFTYPRSTVTPEVVFKTPNLNSPGIFEHDGKIKLIYNDHKDNFSLNNKLWHLLYNNQNGKCCVVVADAMQEGDFEGTVVYTSANSSYSQQNSLTDQDDYFHRILSYDDNAVYYLLKHNKGFRVEKITW